MALPPLAARLLRMLARGASPRTVLDGALLALTAWAGVDLLRVAALGGARTDAWVLGGPAGIAALGLALAALPRRRGNAAAWALRSRLGHLLLAALAMGDALDYHRVLAAGGAGTALPLPASAVFAALFLWGAVRPAPRAGGRAACWLVAGGALPLLVLLHLATFGATDYGRPADAALVFGAKVDERGEASGALYDRTVTACRLYEAGLVHHLVFSGGRNPAVPASEPAVMARIARSRGIPESALILDLGGRNTEATIQGARRLLEERGWQEVLAVSHDVHLARIRLLGRRAGLPLRTVPARETVPWPMKYVFVSREVAAWTWWYARTLLAGLCARAP